MRRFTTEEHTMYEQRYIPRRQQRKSKKGRYAVFFLVCMALAVGIRVYINSETSPADLPSVFSMNRYVFVETPVYTRQGNSGHSFVPSGNSAAPGFYTAQERLKHSELPNYLYINSINGWIREAYTSAAPIIEWTPGTNLPVGTERVDKWYALPFEYKPDDLVTLEWRYCKIRQIELRAEAAAAFKAMVNAAKAEGIHFYGFSGFRSAHTQRELYLNRMKRPPYYNQRGVARPGHSEHQLGTTVDVVGEDTTLAAAAAFGNTPEARWVRRYCYDFGFVLSYGEDNKIESGYIIEPWHLRYIGPQNVGSWLKRHHRDQDFARRWIEKN